MLRELADVSARLLFLIFEKLWRSLREVVEIKRLPRRVEQGQCHHYLQKGLKGEFRNLKPHQFYFSSPERDGTNPPGNYHMSNEAHDWEKPEQTHQEQIVLDKDDCLL